MPDTELVESHEAASSRAAATPVAKRLPRTTLGLRDALFDALDELRGARPDVPKALATAKLAQAITTCMKAELDLIDRMEDGDMGSFKPGTLTLGTEE